MFEVLNFVYDTYWQCADCPTLPVLKLQLRQVGFDTAEIDDALVWMEDLKLAARAAPPTVIASTAPNALAASPTAVRIFSAAEQERIDQSSWGLLIFLVSVGALDANRLEQVMERVMATAGEPLRVDEVKLIVLMVFWSLNKELDALVLDELCDNPSTRTQH